MVIDCSGSKGWTDLRNWRAAFGDSATKWFSRRATASVSCGSTLADGTKPSVFGITYSRPKRVLVIARALQDRHTFSEQHVG